MTPESPLDFLRRMGMPPMAPTTARTPPFVPPGMNGPAMAGGGVPAARPPAPMPLPSSGPAPIKPRTPPTFPGPAQMPAPHPQGAPPRAAPTPGQQDLRRLLEQGPPVPQRANPWKQAAGYALGVLPFTSRTDLPERLIYKGDAPGQRRQYAQELQSAQQLAAMEASQREAALDERRTAAEELRAQAAMTTAERPRAAQRPQIYQDQQGVPRQVISQDGVVVGSRAVPGFEPKTPPERRMNMTDIMHRIAVLESTPERTPSEEQELGTLKRTYQLEQQRPPAPVSPIAQAKEQRAAGAADRKTRTREAVTRWRALDPDPREVLKAFRQAMSSRRLSDDDRDLAPEIEAELVDLAATQGRIEGAAERFARIREAATGQPSQAAAPPAVPQTQRTPEQILENPQRGDRYVDRRGRQLTFDGTNWVVE